MPSQNKINKIWRRIWSQEKDTETKQLFNRFFLESYPIYKKYISDSDNRILDIGAGSGKYSLQFAQDFPNSTIYATDILEESLECIKRFSKDLPINNIITQKEDVFRLSFPDDYFDVVFCDAVIQHLPQYKISIKEMIRVLKPKGKLIVAACNYYNPHTFFKFLLKLLGKQYTYGYEKSFSKKELKKIVLDNNLKLISLDGFYFAYGIYRLKRYYKIFKLVGRVFNKISKIIDRFTKRFVSKNFGFEIFFVAEKPEEKHILKVKNSGIIKLPFFNDYPDGNLIIAESRQSVPFEIKRIYYITNLGNKIAVRGLHAHKRLEQYLFCISGHFTLHLDDGENRQDIVMDNPYYGVKLGSMLWHKMTGFSPNCVILVIASDYFNEDDYIRDYGEFINFVKGSKKNDSI